MNNVRGYIFSREFMGERAPQFVQNLVIRDYCSKNNLNYLLSVTEHAMENSSYSLNKLLFNLKDVDGIVLYSLFQLPIEQGIRFKFYEKITNSKKKIYFALENIQLVSRSSVGKIEDIWNIKKNLPYCLQTINE
tara:strand:- start:15 stop:416 length:402 start_codon:yes stop_codon:yes gene_type:complete